MTTSKCHACGRGGYGLDQLDALLGAYFEDAWYDDYKYEWWAASAKVGQTYEVAAIGNVTLVARKTESPEGYSSVSGHLIFEIDGTLYKKEGTCSSYNSEWDGEFKETHVATREVTYYA